MEINAGYETMAGRIFIVIGFFCILTVYAYIFLNKHIYIQILPLYKFGEKKKGVYI